MSLQELEQRSVLSADGTTIGFTKVGSGPVALVIVHGALSAGRPWVPVATAMAKQVTSYVMDRWGRGGSGSRTHYSLERELEDIEAVLQAAGSSAYVLGHSSGAIYTLEVAARSTLAGMVLYEPPLHGFHGRFVEEVWDRKALAATLPDSRTAMLAGQGHFAHLSAPEKLAEVVSEFLLEAD